MTKEQAAHKITQTMRGQLDALHGKPASYGCHFGMRSTAERDRAEYYAGWNEVDRYLTDGDTRTAAREWMVRTSDMNKPETAKFGCDWAKPKHFLIVGARNEIPGIVKEADLANFAMSFEDRCDKERTWFIHATNAEFETFISDREQ